MQVQEQKKLILFTHFRSSTSWRVRIVLNLKQIPHDFSFVNLIKGEQKSQDYKKINPNGTIPALRLPSDQIIVESMAICQYLEQMYPNIPLLPKDPVKKAQVRAFCEVINSGINPYVNLRRLLENVQKENQANRLQLAKFSATRGMDTIQTILEKTKGKYCFGDEVTLADAFLIPQVEGATHKYGIELAKYPRIKQVFQNLLQIQAIKQAQPKNQSDYEK